MANKNPWIGRKHSEESKKKMSDSRKRYYRDGNIPYNKGVLMTEETKKKISLGKMGQKNHLGFRQSEEARRRMSERQKGDKGSNWRGGLSFQDYSYEWTDTLRKSIRERDGFICQICGVHEEELGGRMKVLDVHHIDYDKHNMNPKNLIALCRNCHTKTNFNREYWINYFFISGN